MEFTPCHILDTTSVVTIPSMYLDPFLDPNPIYLFVWVFPCFQQQLVIPAYICIQLAECERGARVARCVCVRV